MSLYRWFSSASSKLYLPDPSKEETKEKEHEVAKANTNVVEAMESQDRRKRPQGTLGIGLITGTINCEFCDLGQNRNT